MKRKCTNCGGLTYRPVGRDPPYPVPEPDELHDGPFNFYDFSDASLNRIYEDPYNISTPKPFNGHQIVKILELLPEMKVLVETIGGRGLTLEIPPQLIARAHHQEVAILPNNYAIVKIDNEEDICELISVVHPNDRLEYIGKGSWPKKLPNNYFF